MKISITKLYLWILTTMYILMWIPGVPIFNYVDELLTLIILPYVIMNFRALLQKSRLVIIGAIGFLLIGLVSTYLSELSRPLIAIVSDFFTFIKFPITYLYFRYLFTKQNSTYFLNILYILSKFVVVIAFICCLLNYSFELGMTYDIRFGIGSFQFIYNNPGFFLALMVACYSLINYSNNSGDLKYKILAILNMIATLRSVAFGVIALLLVLSVFIGRNLRLYHLFILIPSIIFVGNGAISTYFGDLETPRKLLFQGGIKVFQKFFPLGAGFASYGSNAAYMYYSPLYFQFGFHHIWGLNLEYGNIANDNFWPMIFAQFGFIGSIFYILMMMAIMKDLFIKSMYKNQVVSLSLIIGYLLISSVGANIITGVLGVSMICVYASMAHVLDDVEVSY